MTRACRLEAVPDAAMVPPSPNPNRDLTPSPSPNPNPSPRLNPNQLAASRRALAKGDPRLSKGSAGAPPASKRPVRKELVLRPVRTEPMPLDDYIDKLYTVPPRRVRG